MAPHQRSYYPTTDSLGQSSTVETQGNGPKYKLMKIVDALKEKMSKFFKETQVNTNRCRRGIKPFKTLRWK